MVKITDPEFVRNLGHLLPSLGEKVAITGSICAQGYLYEWLGRNPKRVRLLFQDAEGVEVLSAEGQNADIPFPLQFIPPNDLGDFSPDYQAMIDRRETIRIPSGKKLVSVPMIPVDYLVAMGLCSNDLLNEWYTMALVKVGRDTQNLEGERVRGILKSVGRPEAFEKYKELVYDL